MEPNEPPPGSGSIKDRIGEWQKRTSSSPKMEGENHHGTLLATPPVARPKTLSKIILPSPSPNPASVNQVIGNILLSPIMTPPPKRASSTSTSSEQKQNKIKSPSILRKKIDKVQSMIQEAEEQEKKGRDSKLYKRLNGKLEQYETELTEQMDEVEHKQFESIMLPPPPESPQHKTSNLFPTTIIPDTPKECQPKVLKKKVKKVDQMMSDLEKEHGVYAFQKKEYKKLMKKREEYESALQKFESRMLGQAINEQGGTTRTQTKLLPPPPPLMLANDNEEEEGTDTSTSTSASTSSNISTTKKPKEPKSPKKSPDPAKHADSKEAAYIIETPPKPKSKKRQSSKRGGPRKRSEAVSAPRIQELDKKFEPPVFEKDQAAQDLIRSHIQQSFVFSSVVVAADNDESSVVLDQLVQAFEPTCDYNEGDSIIQQGEEGDYLYIIRSGSVDYEVNGHLVGSAGEGAAFGELALLYSCPRKATVRASSTTTQLFRVDQITVRYILQSQTKFKALWKNAARKIISMNRLLGAAAAVAVTMQLKEPEEEEEPEVEEVDKEVDEPSENTCEGSFNLEGSLNFGDLSQKRLSLQNSMTNSGVTLESFARESVLGEGQFGEVWLVKSAMEELKNQNFALKIQSKQDFTRQANSNMETTTITEAIERECDVLSQFCHPFIVEFVHKFEDDENIYLVMGVIEGVELWSVIHREEENGDWESGIPEANAKFYGLLMADTLNYMHRQNVIFRDMKPENIMIDHTGYPVFVDFGFAKLLPDGRTYTFCGTPNYTCPEIVCNQGHGNAVDHWALGVVIYEMISGDNPFYFDGISELQLLEDITSANPEPLREEYSAEAKDLTTKLLVKDPSKRMGSLAKGGKEITVHPWFEGVDLTKARQQLLRAPFIPPPQQED
jgi:CRP-like cAMP-binding protein